MKKGNIVEYRYGIKYYLNGKEWDELKPLFYNKNNADDLAKCNCSDLNKREEGSTHFPLGKYTYKITKKEIENDNQK